MICRALVDKLLYPECFDSFDLSEVKRRQHRTECIIVKRSSSGDVSDSEDGDNKIRRQDAVDEDSASDSSNSSDDSNPFGYVRYYNPQTGEEREQTKYESFIDYGEVSAPRMVQKQPTVPSIVLTSTATLQLTKQASETSEMSSELVVTPYTACEDLLNIDGSLELGQPASMHYVPVTRQSCPTKLVGNKFNKSSLTTIYIPTWQATSENNLSVSKHVERKSDKIDSDGTSGPSSCSTTTHSSSIDIPVNVAPLPDAMVAELLYNYKGCVEKSESVESDKTELSGKTVIKPPTMFGCPNKAVTKADEKNDLPPAMSLNLQNVGFRTHSINSDKPRRRCSIQVDPVGNECRDLRRCVSHQFMKLSSHKSDHAAVTPCCNFCPNSCHSPRSSDSGMAGSCTLNSPDLASNDTYTTQERCSMDMAALYQKYSDLTNYSGDVRNVISLSEIEARAYESQCQCTSPFGSTPRTSCQASPSENIMTGSQTDSAHTSVTSSSEFSNCPISHLRSSRRNIHVKRSNERGFVIPRQKSKSLTNISSLESKFSTHLEEEAEVEDKTEIYRSGLYAHWWLKAKIPADVIKGIYEETQAPSPTGKG